MPTAIELIPGTSLDEALDRLASEADLCVAVVSHDRRRAGAFASYAFGRLATPTDARLYRGTGAERIVWPNGSRLIVLSAASYAPRGLRLDALINLDGVQLDAAAWVPAFLMSRWAR